MTVQNSPAYDPREPDDTWCDDCGNDSCQCDRDYAEYLEAWLAAVAAGEFDLETCSAGIPHGIASEDVAPRAHPATGQDIYCVEKMALTGARA